MKTLGIGLIGTGYMGKAHAIALKMAGTVFPLSALPVCELLAEVNDELAQQQAQRLGFKRATGDWQVLVNDPAVDIVDICSPNYLHKEMALSAIAAGKHVYSEKPLALTAADALEMTEAAEHAGVKTLVGFNYAKNPASQLAKQIIDNGEIGEILHFRSTFNEDFLADPQRPFSWRLQRAFSGSGALGDLGSHIINMAQYLVGAIAEVNGDLQIVHKKRPLSDGSGFGVVENDDQMHCMLRFSSGAIGTLEASRVAWGRKNGLWYEVNGTQGSLIFDQERLSELQLFSAKDAANRQGFRTLLMGPAHPDYSHFSPAPGHGLGYNDMKACEIRDLLEAVAEDKPLWPDFRAAYQVNQVLDAIERSHRENRWIKVTDV